MPVTPDLLTPLAGESPSGPMVRYDPVYDRIKDARREDPLLDPPVKADWALVEKLAKEVLSKRSKDLWVAAWLTEALLRREGIPGLEQGIELIQGLLEGFWDDLHPQPDEGDLELRVAPLAWIGAYLDVAVRMAPLNARAHDYLGYRESRAVPSEQDAELDDEKRARRAAAIEEGRLDPETFDSGFAATPKPWYKALVASLDGSLERIDTLEGFSDERFGDVSPSFRKVRDALQEVRQAAGSLLDRKLELDPDPIDDSVDYSEGGKPATPSVAAEPAAAGSQSTEPTSRDDAARRIAGAARYLRAQMPTDPAPYLLLRGFRWGELRAGGGEVDPRLLAAPPTELRTRLKGLLLDERWSDLVEAGEGVMATPFGRGWLDLQRYVLTAMEGLGPEFAVAAESVRGALRALLRDLPTLVDATLMDDSATANRETLAWLRAQGLLAAGGDVAEEQISRPEAPGGLTLDPPDKILQRLGTRDPQRGIELLTRAAEQEKSERSRFLRRLEAARLMVDAGLERIAMPILRRSVEQIDQHQLEAWEAGQIVASALGLLYTCMGRLGEDPGTRDALYLRVCRLDPMQAMDFRDDAEPTSPESADGQSGG